MLMVHRIPMIVGAFLLPIGLFWFAWTSNPHISWVPQVIAGIPIGAGILMIFLQYVLPLTPVPFRRTDRIF